ncbi:MAG: hypothetical protein M1482_01465 [Chloroflexi bacterium]|nr:hypothetical protein [Chloroflexota bacterium]
MNGKRMIVAVGALAVIAYVFRRSLLARWLDLPPADQTIYHDLAHPSALVVPCAARNN